jgi:hypothetical protein
MRSDQVAGDYEEYVDTNKATAKEWDTDVKEYDYRDRDTSKSIDVGSIRSWNARLCQSTFSLP